MGMELLSISTQVVGMMEVTIIIIILFITTTHCLRHHNLLATQGKDTSKLGMIMAKENALQANLVIIDQTKVEDATMELDHHVQSIPTMIVTIQWTFLTFNVCF